MVGTGRNCRNSFVITRIFAVPTRRNHVGTVGTPPCHRRVGAELRKAQEAGEIGAQGRRSDLVRASDEVKPTLSEIGIPKQRASEMKRLAEVGEPAIRAEVKRANDEERERNARIVAAREAGETVRQVAEREGVSPRTVHYVQERQTAEIARPCSTPSADFRSPERGAGRVRSSMPEIPPNCRGRRFSRHPPHSREGCGLTARQSR